MARGPIKHTCPAIDRQKKANEDEIKRLRGIIEELEEAINAIEANNDFLEEMRESNDKLREWGAEMEDLSEERQQEIDDLQKELNQYV